MMTNSKMPKCSCNSYMRTVFIRSGGNRIKIGYICRYCNQYKIFKGPNKSGPYPEPLKEDIYIGLKKIIIN